jgi:hypothetical protein
LGFREAPFMCVGFTATLLLAAEARADESVVIHATTLRPTEVVLERSYHPNWRLGWGWEPICSAPCRAPLDRSAAYRVAGPEIATSRGLRLEDAVGSQRLDVRANTGSHVGRIAGWAMFLGGGAIGAVGLGEMWGAGLEPDPHSPEARVGTLAVITGLAVLAGGAILLLASEAHTELAARPLGAD